MSASSASSPMYTMRIPTGVGTFRRRRSATSGRMPSAKTIATRTTSTMLTMLARNATMATIASTISAAVTSVRTEMAELASRRAAIRRSAPRRSASSFTSGLTGSGAGPSSAGRAGVPRLATSGSLPAFGGVQRSPLRTLSGMSERRHVHSAACCRSPSSASAATTSGEARRSGDGCRRACGARRGHHLLRHRRHLRRREERGDARCGAQGSPRRRGHRDEVRARFRWPRARRPSRRWIRIAVEDSLRRLDTDWIDLYQLHTPDPDTPVEETLETLTELVSEGKIRCAGSSNLAGWQIADADWVARSRGLTRFVSAQNAYSLLDRSVEDEVIPACERFDVGDDSVQPARRMVCSQASTVAANRRYPAPALRPCRRQREPMAHRPQLRHRRGARAVCTGTQRHAARCRHRRSRGAAAGRIGHRRSDVAGAGAGERPGRTLAADCRRSRGTGPDRALGDEAPFP